MITNSDLLKGFFTEPAFFSFDVGEVRRIKTFPSMLEDFMSRPSIQIGWCRNWRNLLQEAKVVDGNQIFVGQGLIMKTKKRVYLYFHSSAYS
jgi:hypothetical protein